MGYGTKTVVVGTASLIFALPPHVFCIILRTPASNVANVFVDLGGLSKIKKKILIRPDESITVDLGDKIIAKILENKLDEKDFIRQIAYYSPTADQTLYIDFLEF